MVYLCYFDCFMYFVLILGKDNEGIAHPFTGCPLGNGLSERIKIENPKKDFRIGEALIPELAGKKSQLPAGHALSGFRVMGLVVL